MKKYLAILVVLAPLGTLGVVSVVQLRSEVAALRVDNARLAQPLTETQPYLVDLPHFPALGGVVRPAAQTSPPALSPLLVAVTILGSRKKTFFFLFTL